MVHAYVLFVLMMTRESALATQDFETKLGCEHAAITLSYRLEEHNLASVIWCVPKNGIDE